MKKYHLWIKFIHAFHTFCITFVPIQRMSLYYGLNPEKH